MGNEESLVWVFALGTLTMLVLVFVIITFVVLYNKKMAQKNSDLDLEVKNNELKLLRTVVETQENEREKIAANLHDEVGPLLSTHKLNLSMMSYDLIDGKLTGEMIKKEQNFIDSVIENVRTVSHDLSPHYLLKFGLEKALIQFFNKIESSNVEVKFDFDSLKLTKITAINLYRIILELTNNLIKHDPFTQMVVSDDMTNGELTIILNHDGNGMTNEEFSDFLADSTGLGLSSIMSRVTVLSGRIYFSKDVNGGKVEISVPIMV